MSGIVGSLFNHRGSGIIAKLGTDGHTFNSAGAGKKALTEAVVVVADGVDGSKLADDAVDSEHYTDGSIDNAHLADDAVGADELAANAVVNASIASGAAIAFAKLAPLTANRALISDGSNAMAVSVVTSTEVGYLDGVTSSIQTQMDTKASTGKAIAMALVFG